MGHQGNEQEKVDQNHHIEIHDQHHHIETHGQHPYYDQSLSHNRQSGQHPLEEARGHHNIYSSFSHHEHYVSEEQDFEDEEDEGNFLHDMEYDAAAAKDVKIFQRDAGPSLIDDEIDKIDEVLFHEESELNIVKSVILNVDANVEKNRKSIEVKEVKSETRKKIEQNELEKQIAIKDMGSSRQVNAKDSVQTNLYSVQFSTKDILVPPPEIQIKENQNDEEPQKKEHQEDNAEEAEEKEKIEQICEDIGLDAEEFFKSQQEISDMILSPGYASKSNVELIKVESTLSVKDIQQIHDTFFEDPHGNAQSDYGNILGMEERTLEPEEFGSIKTPTQRCSEATALKFVIDISEPIEIPPPKEKKERKNKFIKTFRLPGGKQLTVKLPDDKPSTRPSNLSSTSSKVSSLSKRSIMNKELTFDQEQEEGETTEGRAPRMSMMMRRTSLRPSELTYDFEGRVSNIEEAMESWYDFNKAAEDATKEIVLLHDIPEETAETASSEEVEEEQRLYREPYFERYFNALEYQKQLRIKNYILQKFMSMHLRRRKVTNFLMDGEPSLEQTNKYNLKLAAYGEVKRVEEEKRTTTKYETELLKDRRNHKFLNCVRLFDNFQNHEETTGTGLIHTKTGKPIPDKLLERYMRRQRVTMDSLCTMRLEYIRIRNKLDEKNQTLNEIDMVTPTRRLIEYEQLKSENRNLADRTEEKDEDLVRIRGKCQAAIQTLAHLREKTAALEADILELKSDLETIDLVVQSNRQAVNQLRKQKKEMRNKINKLKEDSGLLTEPTLLADMEDNKKEAEYLAQRIKELKEDVTSRTKEIRNIRANIQNKKLLIAKQKCRTRSSLSNSKSLSYDLSDKTSLKQKSITKSRVSILSKTSKRSKVHLLGKFLPTEPHKDLFKQNDKVAFDDLVRVKAASRMSMRKRSTFFTSNFKTNGS